MNLKSIFGITVLSILAMNSHASTTHHGKIIRDDLLASTNRNIIFKDTDIESSKYFLKRNENKKMKMSSDYPDDIHSFVKLNNAAGSVNEPPETRGEFRVLIYNNSSHTKQYNIRYYVLFLDDNNNVISQSSHNLKLVLDSHGDAALEKNIFATEYFKVPGKYHAMLQIDVEADNGGDVSASTNSDIAIS